MNNNDLIEVPPVRVKHYNYKTEEENYGTVIDLNTNRYLVIPDYNLSITEVWLKSECDVIK